MATTPAANEFHAVLRKQSIEEGIRLIRSQIQQRGYEITKADPGVQAWVMENKFVLSQMARMGGMSAV